MTMKNLILDYISFSIVLMKTCLLSRPIYYSSSFPLTIYVDSFQIPAAPSYLPYDFRIAYVIQEFM